MIHGRLRESRLSRIFHSKHFIARAQSARLRLVALLVLGLVPLAGAHAAAPAAKTVLVLGDSIAAGYGIEPSQAFPALIQKKIDAKGWPFKIVSAAQSGDTSAGGLGRIDWLLKNRIDVLVLELGANDGLRGVPAEVTQTNLQAIIDRTKEKYPDAKIVVTGMRVPGNMGRDYSRQFAAIFSDLAKKNDAALVPFVLEGVAGMRELNLADGIHPTAKGHEIVAQNVWKVLEPVLRSIR